MAIVKEAEADKAAAEERAEKLRLLADAEAYADSLRRASEEQRYAIEAQARKTLNEAENILSPEAMELRVRLATLDRVEGVIRESAKPLENISDIKILHVDGLTSGGASGSSDLTGQSISDQVMSSALKYRLQEPLLKSLLESAGIHPTDAANTLIAPNYTAGTSNDTASTSNEEQHDNET